MGYTFAGALKSLLAIMRLYFPFGFPWSWWSDRRLLAHNFPPSLIWFYLSPCRKSAGQIPEKGVQKSRWRSLCDHRLQPCLAISHCPMVVSHSVKLSFDFSLLASIKKMYAEKTLHGTSKNTAWNGFACKKIVRWKSLSSRIFSGRGLWGTYIKNRNTK